MGKQWADLGYMLLSAGWYCVGCEEYKQDDEIDEQHNCPIHRKPCVHREEENFFFKLSNYQQQLEVSTICVCCGHESTQASLLVRVWQSKHFRKVAES